MSNNNFAWVLEAQDGELLAYQEKKRPNEVEAPAPVIPDLKKALRRCEEYVMGYLYIKNKDGKPLPYLEKVKNIANVLFIQEIILNAAPESVGPAAAPKSSLILPGDAGFGTI